MTPSSDIDLDTAWRAAVPAALRSKCAVSRVDGGVLLVNADDACAAYELSMRMPEVYRLLTVFGVRRWSININPPGRGWGR